MKDKSLINEIEIVISSRREGEYWDFKENYHSNKANLLHDIICMSNNRVDRDGYIIFGISDDYEIVGVEEDTNRKTQQNIIDFVKGKKFSGGIRPSVELKTVIVKSKQIDVLIVKNSTDTPYFLVEDYQDQVRKVRANYIYTRVGDTNTDIDKSADINHIEYLWKKRFLLNRPPLEQIKQKLQFKDEWQREEDTCYYLYNPEYTISLEYDEESDRPEFYSYLMTNQNTSYGVLEIRYFGTKLFSRQYVILDGGRYTTTVPEWGFITFDNAHDETYSYKYFIKDSINYLLHEFLLKDEHEAIWARNRFYKAIIIFNSEMEKELFEEYIERNQLAFKDIISRETESDLEIEDVRKREKAHIKNKIQTGIVLKSLLEKYREEENMVISERYKNIF